jgi:hypothetical protein
MQLFSELLVSVRILVICRDCQGMAPEQSRWRCAAAQELDGAGGSQQRRRKEDVRQTAKVLSKCSVIADVMVSGVSHKAWFTSHSVPGVNEDGAEKLPVVQTLRNILTLLYSQQSLSVHSI